MVAGGGGSGCSGCVSFSADGYDVVGEPIETTAGTTPVPALMWLVIPGQAQWLKEFFDVKMIVSNLASAPFSFDNGSISINDLPSGLSLAPTDPAPTLTHAVADIPAGGSVSSDWVLRGDAEGFYAVSATYNGTLDPIGVPISFQISTQPAAIHVWGGSALQMTVDADDQANYGDPYLVRVGLTNVADIPVYNAGVELLTQGRSGYIYQPDQQLEYSTAEIDPGQTFWTDYYRLIPEGQSENPLNLSQSFVQQTGGNVDVASTIESHPATPPDELPAFNANPEADGIHLSWDPPSVSGITGYEVFYTPTRDTPFGSTPVATVPATTNSVVIPYGASGLYALSTETASGITDYHPLVEATSVQTASGSITLSKSTALIGNLPIKVSGTGWNANGDASVTVYECATTYYTAQTCDGANHVTANLGTGTKAGKFTNAPITLATGSIDDEVDTCGIAGSGPCYLVVVGNNGDSTSSAALGFVSQSLIVKRTTALLGNYVDALTGAGFPAGDTITAQECDASVAIPATVGTECDPSTQVTATAAANGKVAFSPGINVLVGAAFSDEATGVCAVGGTCKLVVTDTNNSLIGLGTSVTFATPSATLKKTTAVLGNSTDAIAAAGFPAGDTITAEECDASVTIPGTLSTDCDASTQITGIAAATGKVTFSSPGVNMLVGAAYADASSGMCAAGGTCEIVVSDSANSAVGLELPVSFAAPAVTLSKSTAVAANYLDKVTASGFPVGDTVVAEECDSSVNAATNLATNCDTATAISGTVGASGKVTFSPTGVTVRIGSSYTESGTGSVVAGGSGDIVVADSTNPALSVAIPITLAL